MANNKSKNTCCVDASDRSIRPWVLLLTAIAITSLVLTNLARFKSINTAFLLSASTATTISSWQRQNTTTYGLAVVLEQQFDEKATDVVSPGNATEVAKWSIMEDCGFGFGERGHHKFKKGAYGVQVSFQPVTENQHLICQSRYYIVQGLMRVLSDVARQTNVSVVLAYGTLLSYYRYQDIMPWDADADVYLLTKDMDVMFDAVKSNQVTVPSEYRFLLKTPKPKPTKPGRTPPRAVGACDHPIAFYHVETGFYIDLMRLEERGSIYTHASYRHPKKSYHPLVPCSLGTGIDFECPSNIMHFIGPPGRDYGWETLKLLPTLNKCPYYDLIHNKTWNFTTIAGIYDIFGSHVSPVFDWLKLQPPSSSAAPSK